MAQYDITYCPRCNAGFECKPGNITECQCYGPAFSVTEKEYIQDNYDGCLCRKCLDEIKDAIVQFPEIDTP